MSPIAEQIVHANCFMSEYGHGVLGRVRTIREMKSNRIELTTWLGRKIVWRLSKKKIADLRNELPGMFLN